MLALSNISRVKCLLSIILQYLGLVMRCNRWAQIAMKRRAFSLDLKVFTGQYKGRDASHGFSELNERGWIKLSLPKCLNCNLVLLRNTPVSNLGPICFSLRIRLRVAKKRPKTLHSSLSLRWYNVACLPGGRSVQISKRKRSNHHLKKKVHLTHKICT